MKKTIITLSLVALFSLVSNAQEKKATPETKPVSTTVVNSDGTVSTVTTSPSTKQESPVKKSGTRMAINEKGLPGGSASTKKQTTSTAKEEKGSSTTGQPGASTKKTN